MTNKSKALGTNHETAILKHLRELGYEAERLSLSGAQDEGDLLLKAGVELIDVGDHMVDMRDRRFVIEAKNTKGFTPADWVRQAKIEASNYATHRGVAVPHWVVIAKARQKPISEAYVITTLSEWLSQVDG